MSDEQDAEKNQEPDGSQEPVQSLIPIETIDGTNVVDDGPFIPRVLRDDPDVGDGSASREGVPVSSRRLRTLGKDRLESLWDPKGSDRKSRKTRRVHRASKKARSEKGRKSRKIIGILVAFLAVAVVVGVAGIAISYVYEQWGGKTIPYVTGLSVGNATELLEAKGLRVTTETVPADVVEGHVISVDPAEGTRVDELSVVHLVVGESRIIPDVIGMSRDQARETLEAAGAENIRFTVQMVTEDEDKVLEVSPAVGSVFISSEEITVVVAQMPRMPDIVGEDEDTAFLHLEHEGVVAQKQWERGTAEQRLLVVRTVPEAGGTVGADGATVFFGDPLISVARIGDYFDATAPHLVEFLKAEGYTPRVGYTAQDGHVRVRFNNSANVTVSVVPDPWSHAIDQDKTAYSDVMKVTAHIDGVRLTIPVNLQADGTSPTTASVLGIKKPTVSEATAKDIMKACGFSDMLDSCTQDSIVLPRKTKASGHAFFCCYGEINKNVWTILIKGATVNGKVSAREIVVTCAPRATYTALNLSNFGDKICNFVAYQDEYR